MNNSIPTTGSKCFGTSHGKHMSFDEHLNQYHNQDLVKRYLGLIDFQEKMESDVNIILASSVLEMNGYFLKLEIAFALSALSDILFVGWVPADEKEIIVEVIQLANLFVVKEIETGYFLNWNGKFLPDNEHSEFLFSISSREEAEEYAAGLGFVIKKNQ